MAERTRSVVCSQTEFCANGTRLAFSTHVVVVEELELELEVEVGVGLVL